MVISPFLFLGLSVGIGYLQGSSMAKNSKVAVVTTVPSVAEGIRDTNGINFDYQDDASAQAAIKDEKIKGYLTIDQEDSVIKAVYHGETSLETGIKLAVTNKLNELQDHSIARQLICPKSRKNAWLKLLTLLRRLTNPRKIKSWSKPLRLQGLVSSFI